jgi:hypothetical protein
MQNKQFSSLLKPYSKTSDESNVKVAGKPE